MKAFEKKLFMTFYYFARSKKCVGRFFAVASIASTVVFPLVYGYLLIALLCNGHINDLVFAAVVPLFSLAVSVVLKRVVNRKRPSELYGLKGDYPVYIFKAKKKWPSSGSFPSNHATSAFIIAISCYFISIYIFAVMFAVALITAMARVFNGAHYVSDIVGALLISGFSAIVGYNIVPAVLRMFNI
jgi:membrane-associated phospholipid phosphatase